MHSPFLSLGGVGNEYFSFGKVISVHELNGSFVFEMEEETAPAPVLLSGKSQGQRRLGGYSPWARRELDVTEHCTLSSKL